MLVSYFVLLFLLSSHAICQQQANLVDDEEHPSSSSSSPTQQPRSLSSNNHHSASTNSYLLSLKTVTNEENDLIGTEAGVELFTSMFIVNDDGINPGATLSASTASISDAISSEGTAKYSRIEEENIEERESMFPMMMMIINAADDSNNGIFSIMHNLVFHC